jgi:pyridoxal phosphate enzyme (YggS family)
VSGAEPFAARLESVRRRIAGACVRAGRDPSSVRLIAVTKTHPAAVVREAARAGLTDFGENRVQEGVAKIEALRGEFPGLAWHLIGRLQSNKAKTAVKYFQEIESVDRDALVGKIAAEARARNRVVPVFLEINLGSEQTKGGVAPGEATTLLHRALAEAGLEVRGLMAVPPYQEDPAAARPDFRQLRALRDRLREATGAALPELSMGMSRDFEEAIEEGSTTVRVGTALFGERS